MLKEGFLATRVNALAAEARAAAEQLLRVAR
jgi:hypothetical protein